MDQLQFNTLLSKLSKMDETLEGLKSKIESYPEDKIEPKLCEKEQKLKDFLESSFW